MKNAHALEVVEKSFRDTPVLFQQEYTLVTPIAAKFKKKLEAYLRNERTADYLAALEQRHGESIGENSSRWGQNDTIGRNSGRCEFVKKVTSGPRALWGTWLHRKMLIDFARWLDPHFAVWCDEQIEELLVSRAKAAVALPPPAEPKRLAEAPIEKRYWDALQHHLWSVVYKEGGCSLRINSVTSTPAEFAVFLTGRIQHTVSAEWMGRSLRSYCDTYPHMAYRKKRMERCYTIWRPGFRPTARLAF